MTGKSVESMEDVIRKIKKCLALANDGKNSDESDTIMLTVQKLMAKHKLSMQDIDLEGEQKVKKNVKYEDGTEFTKLQWWHKILASIIAENFRCFSFIQHYSRKTKVVFLGIEEDIEICKAVYNFAMISIKFHSDIYIKERGISGDRGRTIAIKNDFIGGYLQGLSDKFKEQVQRENWGLILVKDAIVIKEYQNLNLSRGKASTRSSRGDTEARAKGYNEGKNFSHKSNAISGR